MYCTGVRVSELLDIKINDIDRDASVIHIMKGKGNKQRMVPVDSYLQGVIDDYISEYSPQDYLFIGQLGGKYSDRSINQFIKKYASSAGITKKVYAHLIRHCSFSHSLDSGNDIYHIKEVAGHNSIKTTSQYLHLSPSWMKDYKSPMQKIL